MNNASNPASIGSVVALYGTGGGTFTTDALPRLTLPVAATVEGIPATIYYAGRGSRSGARCNADQRADPERRHTWSRCSGRNYSRRCDDQHRHDRGSVDGANR